MVAKSLLGMFAIWIDHDSISDSWSIGASWMKSLVGWVNVNIWYTDSALWGKYTIIPKALLIVAKSLVCVAYSSEVPTMHDGVDGLLLTIWSCFLDLSLFGITIGPQWSHPYIQGMCRMSLLYISSSSIQEDLQRQYVLHIIARSSFRTCIPHDWLFIK